MVGGVSFAIAKVIQAVTGLRVNGEIEERGLELRLHGERGYNR
jgi:ammonia channel protein AmtB